MPSNFEISFHLNLARNVSTLKYFDFDSSEFEIEKAGNLMAGRDGREGAGPCVVLNICAKNIDCETKKSINCQITMPNFFALFNYSFSLICEKCKGKVFIYLPT